MPQELVFFLARERRSVCGRVTDVLPRDMRQKPTLQSPSNYREGESLQNQSCGRLFRSRLANAGKDTLHNRKKDHFFPLRVNLGLQRRFELPILISPAISICQGV